QVLEDKDHFTNALQQNIAAAVRQTDTLSPEEIQRRLEELQIELIKRANDQDDYKAITDEIFRLRAQKQQSESENTLQDETLSRIRELQDFIAAQPTELAEFDETVVKRLIQKITVYADKFTVEFKSGVSVDINE
ncbi:MAG: recombinase family protein, partial [Oscillospiraceae bacterium]|nr:recombinase family protein [Oscillospiraceae bacterium]